MQLLLGDEVDDLAEPVGGSETPTTPTSMISGSAALPRRAAAAVPMTMPAVIQISAAPMTRERVTGVACTICGITREPRLTNDSRSRSMSR